MFRNIFVIAIIVFFTVTLVTPVNLCLDIKLNESNFSDKISINPVKDLLIPKENYVNNHTECTNELKTIIWDNGSPKEDGVLILSQKDEVFPFNAQVADDFMFENSDKEVSGVCWWGNFWGVGEPLDSLDFNIYFYADDGTGNAPTGGGLENPETTALKSYFIQNVSGINDSGQRFYSVELPTSFIAIQGEKYWLVIQAVFEILPKWGRVTNDGTIFLANSMCGCPLLGNPFWVDHGYGDMAWYLTGGINEPPDVPEVHGPTKGKPGLEICFTFQSTDPNGDDVMYMIDWGDGNTTETDFYPQSTPIGVCHTWYEKGCYLFRCKAKDIYDAESELLEFLFWVDGNRISYISILQIILGRFEIIEKLLIILN